MVNGFTLQVAKHLTATYGGRAFEVAKMAQVTGKRWPIVGKRLVSEFPYIESEVSTYYEFRHEFSSVLRFTPTVYYCKFCRKYFLSICILNDISEKLVLPQVQYAIKEYACTAIDVIARRTRLGFLNVQAAEEALPRIVEIMGKQLRWSEQKKRVATFLDILRLCPQCHLMLFTNSFKVSYHMSYLR